MPFRVKHFIHGLSSICPTIKSNAKAKSKAETGSYGTVGMIDNKDVPSLVLQILLCKYELSTFLKIVYNAVYCINMCLKYFNYTLKLLNFVFNASLICV